MYTKPEVGKIVEVVTDWSDIFRTYSTNVQIKNNKQTDVGQVVASEKFDEPFSFRITTGKANHPTGVIPLKRVTNLRYVDGAELEQVKAKPVEESKTWTVAGSKGSEYIVTQTRNAWSCTCPGFQFRRQCKHVNEKQQG